MGQPCGLPGGLAPREKVVGERGSGGTLVFCKLGSLEKVVGEGGFGGTLGPLEKLLGEGGFEGTLGDPCGLPYVLGPLEKRKALGEPCGLLCGLGHRRK